MGSLRTYSSLRSLPDHAEQQRQPGQRCDEGSHNPLLGRAGGHARQMENVEEHIERLADAPPRKQQTNERNDDRNGLRPLEEWDADEQEQR